jgi:segregation and condensation protein A
MPVSLQVAGHQMEGYRINTSVYEGPLDLLLDLIEKAQLDITKLALSQVTDQYLAYMRNLVECGPAEVSAFLVIAARLVLIKSMALLPHQSVPDRFEKEEDDGEALAQQLIQYRRFKQLAAWLADRENAGLHTYLRLASPAPRFEPRLDMENITLDDLVKAAYNVFTAKGDLPALSKVISMPRITIREKIQAIVEALHRDGRTTFRRLAGSQTKLELVITFLALLELIKRSVIEVEQTTLFGEIDLRAIASLADNPDVPENSEFGE